MTEPKPAVSASTSAPQVSASAKRGSILLGISIPVAVMLGRLVVHWSVTDGPFAGTPEFPDGGPLTPLVRQLAVDPWWLITGTAVAGVVLLLIPRTRRTGLGMLLGTVLCGLALVGLVFLIVEGLRNFSVF